MEDISIWLRDFITEFRKESGKLSQEERSRISNLDDFFPPCQVILLWFKDANLQYLICSHDSSRNDMEIDIEGPIPTYEAIDRMSSILKDPKWSRPLSEEEKKHVLDKNITFSEILEGAFLNMIQEIRNKFFQKPLVKSLCRSKSWLTSRSFLWTIEGNIAEMDKKKLVAKTLEQAKKEATRAKAPPPPQPPPKPLIDSCATYFYPPIWVGKLPRKTFREKVHGSFMFPKKAFDLGYKGRVLVINQNGLIAIGEENVPKATRMLNEIMATFVLMGFEASAVRELEVGEAKIDASTLALTQWGTRAYTLRTQLSASFPSTQQTFQYRTEIKKEDLIRVIKQAERICKDPDISDFLSFFLEAHTHLDNSEYSQSFIMSWVIVERQMYWLWKKFLKEEQIPRKRRGKLTNPTYWTIDFVLEGLSLGGQLSKEDYSYLMSLKSKRNDIIHVGEATTLEEAEKCFNVAKSIVKQRSGLSQT